MTAALVFFSICVNSTRAKGSTRWLSGISPASSTYCHHTRPHTLSLLRLRLRLRTVLFNIKDIYIDKIVIKNGFEMLGDLANKPKGFAIARPPLQDSSFIGNDAHASCAYINGVIFKFRNIIVSKYRYFHMQVIKLINMTEKIHICKHNTHSYKYYTKYITKDTAIHVIHNT